MASPKAGKKFKYDLEAVLKVRGIKEKKEQEKFAEKSREYLTQKQKEDADPRREKRQGRRAAQRVPQGADLQF